MKPRAAPALAALATVWLVFLLPSVLFNQWFTLDMGGMFAKAADYPANIAWALSPYNLGGRFFPAYWLYHFAVFGVFTTNVAAHFAVQAAIFVVALAMACRLLYRLTGSLAATVVFGTLACLGGAVAENLHTLGKAEPLAFFFIMTAITLFAGLDRARRLPAAARFVIVAVMVALAMWSKETSMVMLVLAPAAVAAGIYVHGLGLRDVLRTPGFGRWALLLVAVIGGFLLSKAPYVLAPRGPQGKAISYVEYDITLELVAENVAFYATQQPDVLLFGLAAVWLCWRAARRLRAGGADARARADFMLVTGLLAMAWGYYGGLLIWRWPMGYYMLLPGIVFKLAAVHAATNALRSGAWTRRTRAAALGLAALAGLYALLQSFYVVTSQITYSRMYTEAISRYMALSTPRNRLILESFPFYSEQVTNTRQVIELLYGEKRDVTGVADLLDPAVATPEVMRLLRITHEQLAANRRSLPREGDYLLLMTGNKLATWFVRGVTPYYSEDSILGRDRAYDLIPVAEGRAFAPGAFMNVWTYRLNLARTYVGYKLYKVTNRSARIVWTGRYPDGWLGPVSSVRLSSDYGERARVTLSTPGFNSPNRVRVWKDGKLLRDLALTEGHEVQFDVATGGTGAALNFFVERTAVPRELGLNRDKRELGVLSRIEPLKGAAAAPQGGTPK